MHAGTRHLQGKWGLLPLCDHPSFSHHLHRRISSRHLQRHDFGWSGSYFDCPKEIALISALAGATSLHSLSRFSMSWRRETETPIFSYACVMYGTPIGLVARWEPLLSQRQGSYRDQRTQCCWATSSDADMQSKPVFGCNSFFYILSPFFRELTWGMVLHDNNLYGFVPGNSQ